MSIIFRDSINVKTFVCYTLWTPHSSETHVEEIESSDLVQAAIAQAPNRAYCFGFYEQEVISRTTADDRADGLSEPMNFSGLYFINALLLDEHAAREAGIRNFSPGEYVKTRYETIAPFRPDRDLIVRS